MITKKVQLIALLLLIFLTGSSVYYNRNDRKNSLNGAWQSENNYGQQVLLFVDGYFSHTAFNKKEKKFVFTRGGTFESKKDQLSARVEFDTRQRDEIGKTVSYSFSFDNKKLILDFNGQKEAWKQIDNGTDQLAGTWRITARKQDGKVVPIHQTGARKTLKILSGTRFQWAAINPETKEFFGTGGGTYIFKEGRYSENIEFFSRDSTRVGASLTFDGSLKDGDWHHSGLSSKGDSIYEVWSRLNKH